MALGLLVGYLVGLSLLGVAALKPLFPENVGLIVVNGTGRAGRVFSLSIDEATGALRASLLATDLAFLVFGGCVPLTSE